MEISTHEIELTFENEQNFKLFQERLDEVSKESLTITDMETSKGMGIVGELFLIQFVASMIANVASGLMANAIYDCCKQDGEDSVFSVTVDGVEVTCRTIEDVEKLIALTNKDTDTRET